MVSLIVSNPLATFTPQSFDRFKAWFDGITQKVQTGAAEVDASDWESLDNLAKWLSAVCESTPLLSKFGPMFESLAAKIIEFKEQRSDKAFLLLAGVFERLNKWLQSIDSKQAADISRLVEEKKWYAALWASKTIIYDAVSKLFSRQVGPRLYSGVSNPVSFDKLLNDEITKFATSYHVRPAFFVTNPIADERRIGATDLGEGHTPEEVLAVHVLAGLFGFAATL